MMGFKYSLRSIHNEYLPWERMKYLWPERQERPEGTGQPEQAEQAVLAMHKSAVRELAEQLLQPKADNRDNGLHMYMFRILWDMYGRFESFFKIKPDGETKALLAATGIAIYNNLGKSVDAGHCVTLWKRIKALFRRRLCFLRQQRFRDIMKTYWISIQRWRRRCGMCGPRGSRAKR